MRPPRVSALAIKLLYHWAYWRARRARLRASCVRLAPIRKSDMAIKKYFFFVILAVLQLIFADVISSYFLFYLFELKGYERPNFSYRKDGWAPSVVVASKMYSEVVQRMATSSPLEQCTSGAQPKFYHSDETYGYGHSQGRYVFTECPNDITPK
jgi:hypothetical protein